MRAVAPAEAEKLLDTVDRLPADVAESLSAPFLICETDEWASARRKIAVFGQETFGWDYLWAEGGLSHRLLEGLNHKDRIHALTRTAARFDLGAAYPGTPFWRAYQLIADELEGGDRRKILWGNLARCDTSPNDWAGVEGRASVWSTLSYPNLDALCDWQADLFKAEIQRSGCKAAVFFTGPNYDYLIKRSLRDVWFEPVFPDIPEREFARVISPVLPDIAFRLYHPGYLHRSNRWDHLRRLVEALRAAPKA